VEKPPAERPPAERPPAERPPAEKPPVEKPPAERPPAERPPAERPPAERPPAEKPPAEKPPVEKPPAERPPAERPPVEKKPAEIDDLRELMQRVKKIEAKRAAQELGVDMETIREWSKRLERDGIIEIHSKFLGGVELKLSKDALKRIKEIEEMKKAELLRRELRRLREEAKLMRRSV